MKEPSSSLPPFIPLHGVGQPGTGPESISFIPPSGNLGDLNPPKDGLGPTFSTTISALVGGKGTLETIATEVTASTTTQNVQALLQKKPLVPGERLAAVLAVLAAVPFPFESKGDTR
jgi:hypothetical protein